LPREGKVNREEVMAVASLLVAAVRHPAYANQTFGVISLLGDDQAYDIDAILRQKLLPEEYDSRRIICGNSSQFQGDERDVIFLSMVDTPGEGPLRLRNDTPTKQRFNVAASRARNQLWIVHSLDHQTDLQPGDIRRLLLEHAYDPGAAVRDLATLAGRTESPFEREVLEQLVRARFRVSPQWEVGAYRIDFVVGEEGNRLAVECDGDRYHPIEKLPDDLARQAVLERLGWRFHRIRGSHFYRDREKTMRRLFAKLQELGIQPQADQAQDPPTSNLLEEIKSTATVLRQEWQIESLPSVDQETVEQSADRVTEGLANPDVVRPFHAWQISLESWRRLKGEYRSKGDMEGLRQIGGLGSDLAHRLSVKKAMTEGLAVPQEVLADYPDLRPTTD